MARSERDEVQELRRRWEAGELSAVEEARLLAGLVIERLRREAEWLEHRMRERVEELRKSRA